MAQPLPVDPDDQMIGLEDDDIPQFPPKPYYIPLPPYFIRNLEKPVFAIARLYLGPDGSSAFVTFHPRIGCNSKDVNLDFCLPVPPRDIFHIRKVRGEEEKILLPLDGRSYGFPLYKTWKVCVANSDTFSLEETTQSELDRDEAEIRRRELEKERRREQELQWEREEEERRRRHTAEADKSKKRKKSRSRGPERASKRRPPADQTTVSLRRV